MQSEIYEACRQGYTDLVQVLIQSSPDDADISHLEPNGSTALHVACSHGFIDIVRLLLNDSRVDRHRMNEDGRSAYEVASSEEIRRLFSPCKRDLSRFCTDVHTVNPLEVIISNKTSDERYIHIYPNESPILYESYMEVLEEQSVPLFAIGNWFQSLFGVDPHKTKYENWFKALQMHIKHCLIDEPLNVQGQPMPNYDSYAKACECLDSWSRTRNVEHLLKLYTLNSSISQYFAKTPERTNCLYTPISFDLLKLHERAYPGCSYRGLTMTTTEYIKYQQAFLFKTSYIRTKTFCSTSIDESVANMFAESAQTSDTTVRVIMNFIFPKPCSTALMLVPGSLNVECVTNFADEQEVLILPGTIFSVKNIRENQEERIVEIFLEHYDTTEHKAEMHEERFRSFIDTFILDT